MLHPHLRLVDRHHSWCPRPGRPTRAVRWGVCCGTSESICPGRPVPVTDRIRLLLADLATLIGGTARVWWRLLPQLLGVYLLGWLGAAWTCFVAEPRPPSRLGRRPGSGASVLVSRRRPGRRRRGAVSPGEDLSPPSKLVAALLVVVCVLVAAVAVRVSEPNANYHLQVGRLGEPFRVDEAEVTVSRVRVGTALAVAGEVTARTPGPFVVVAAEMVNIEGREATYLGDHRLLSEHRTYAPYLSGTTLGPDPGYAATIDLAFEVDPPT